MGTMGLDVRPTPYQGPQLPGLEVEMFKARVETQTLYVELIQGGGPTPMVTAQLFVGPE